MRVSKPLLYCNIVALLVNGIIVWLMAVRMFPLMLGLTLVVAFLLGSVWLSCKVNKVPLKQGQPGGFYSAPTERMESL